MGQREPVVLQFGASKATAWLASIGCDVYVVCDNRHWLDYLRANHPAVHITQAKPPYHLEAPPGWYDLIVVEGQEPRDKAADQVVQYLRPGGALVVDGVDGKHDLSIAMDDLTAEMSLGENGRRITIFYRRESKGNGSP